VDQVAGLDHAPLATLETVGLAQKSGTPWGRPLTPGVWAWASWAVAGEVHPIARQASAESRILCDDDMDILAAGNRAGRRPTLSFRDA
jgi:hypothetical protein